MYLRSRSWEKYFHSWIFLLAVCSGCFSYGSEISVKYLKAPLPVTRHNSAEFLFEVFADCSSSSINCKLDDQIPADCQSRRVSYANLLDGNHSFELCLNDSRGVGCASYNWIVDTIPPTALITASTSFTGDANVSVTITFNEPCTGGGGGFSCSSVHACNLLVYGAGRVIPNTLKILQPNLKFSLLVSLSSSVQHGRMVLAMDKGFCKDNAGNSFTRTTNSSFLVHFDRRSVVLNMSTHIPPRLLQLDGETRMVQATNVQAKLKVYLYFSEPVLNSSAEILDSLHTSHGFLSRACLKSHGNRRFGFVVENLTSFAIVSVIFHSNSIISRKGTSVSPVEPVTFLYDPQRPVVRLSTPSNKKTREHSIPFLIEFIKPVFGFNSSHISVSGGHLQSFSKQSASLYVAEVQLDDDVVSISVPENITMDVAGNRNLGSNILQLRHYSVPVISSVLSIFVTSSIAGTSLTAGLLAVSTSSLLSSRTYSRPSSFLATDPARNLLRTVCHVQIFALSRWMAVDLPVGYYEFVRSLGWTIPYLSLPWEPMHSHLIIPDGGSPSSFSSYDLKIFRSWQPDEEVKATALRGSPLSPRDYIKYFESPRAKPGAANIMDSWNSKGWGDFGRTMFWLAVFSCGLILLHALLLLILKFKTKSSEKQSCYGALALPRFEIFLIILALPCLSEASAALIKVGGASRIAIGSLLMGVVAFLLLALFSFLSHGITFGGLLHYKEVHHENLEFHWYHEIMRATLGPGKRGQWTWKNQSSSVRLIGFGPLFEDLRGPPKYMLSQIFEGGTHTQPGEQIIASDDETDDAEAPFIQKLFGILRIYYILLESLRRVCLGIMAGLRLSATSTIARAPTITSLSVTSFQIFFLVLKKPFIKKRVQLLEAISVATELGIFATCSVLLEREFSGAEESKVGIFMVSLFFFGFLAQMMNVLHGLYRQVQQLDLIGNSFCSGLKAATTGLLLLIFPQKMFGRLQCWLPVDGDDGDGDRRGTLDKPWMKRIKGLAMASFSKSGHGGGPSSPSPGFSRERGSCRITSADARTRSNGLYRDLEVIFASK